MSFKGITDPVFTIAKVIALLHLSHPAPCHIAHFTPRHHQGQVRSQIQPELFFLIILERPPSAAFLILKCDMAHMAVIFVRKHRSGKTEFQPIHEQLLAKLIYRITIRLITALLTRANHPTPDLYHFKQQFKLIPRKPDIDVTSVFHENLETGAAHPKKVIYNC